MKHFQNTISSFFLIVALLIPSLASAQQISPNKALVDSSIISDIRNFAYNDIVRLSIENQNRKYKGLSQDKISELDNIWVAETKSKDQPLIASTLTCPLSLYLVRAQAHSIGLYTEIFAMDSHGLNVGQSNISSDYWQGDEDKFQKTYPLGADAVFIDSPEYNSELGIWVAQVSMSIPNKEGTNSIGAITVDVNLSEIERRKSLGLL